MTPTDVARLEAYLRTTLRNDRIRIEVPKGRGSAEVHIGTEFLGTVHRDEDDGEVSFSVHIMILEEDLPAMAVPKKAAPRR